MKLLVFLVLFAVTVSCKTVMVEVSPSGNANKFFPGVVSVQPNDTVSFMFKADGFDVVSGSSYCCEPDAQTQPAHFDSGTKGNGETFDLLLDPAVYPSGTRVQYFSRDKCSFGAGTVGEIWVVEDLGNKCSQATTATECTDVTGQGTPSGLIPVMGACVWCGKTTSATSTEGFCFEPYWSAKVGIATGAEDCPGDTEAKFIPDYECPNGYTARVGCQSYPAAVPANKHVKPANPPCASTSESTILVAALSLMLLAILL